MKEQDRVVVLNPIVGICNMQVCVAEDATDKEILEFCNSENPSGTTKGWSVVVRKSSKDYPENCLPIKCADLPGRIHLLIGC